ncbi:MAG TPA: tol-pal system-associated acyl-CoA thioesterase [Gammaproteobacteria bacterium]|nr:tol-pal system-associated acyl-CoA thioesterase [Gammaproteobacteria bacterium]
MAEFSWPVRVYYEDTDNGGVVYYANYLKFMERARTEWLRARGVEQDVLMAQEGLIFAVRSAQLDYLKPARFNQLLSVSVGMAETGKASLTFDQTVNLITEGDDEVKSDLLLCQGRIRIACLDANSLKPRVIPALIRQEIFGDG